MTVGTHLTIRQMCDEFNVAARTLRFYEARELLFPLRVGQKSQIVKTYQIAQERLADLICKRDDLTQVVQELREQIKWGENLINALPSKNDNSVTEITEI